MSAIIPDIMYEFCELDDVDFNVFVEKIKAALENGADPNEENEHDMTAFGILMNATIPRFTHKGAAAIQMLHALIEAGGNPLLNDRALGKTQDLVIGRDMIEMVVRVGATGQHLLDEDGGTFLHVLAEDDPETFARMVSMGYSDINASSVDESFFVSNNWFKTPRQSDGATPVHLLLSESSVVGIRVDEDMDADEFVSHACDAILGLHEMEFDFGVQDHSGKTAATVIVEMSKKIETLEDDIGYDVFANIKAIHEQSALGQSTPKVSGQKTGPRF